MFFRKKQAHLLDPIVENLDSLKSLTVTPLPLYNWDTQEPQSFALSMTENNGDYHIKGSIVEQSRFRPTNGLTNDDRTSIVHHHHKLTKSEPMKWQPYSKVPSQMVKSQTSQAIKTCVSRKVSTKHWLIMQSET